MPTEFTTRHRSSDRPLREFAIVALFVTLFVGLGCFYAGRANALRGLAPTVRKVEARPVPRELPEGVERFHDVARGVTCWKLEAGYRGGIACLPDPVLRGFGQE